MASSRKKADADIQIAYCFAKLQIPLIYMDVWDIDDLLDFLDCYSSNEPKNGKSIGRTYTEENLDEF